MQALDELPFPTVAPGAGAAYGGALGLVCACDIVLASENARFCLSEVTLGLVPAVISPYVVRAMGMRQARRYMLSAEPSMPSPPADSTWCTGSASLISCWRRDAPWPCGCVATAPRR